MNGSKTINSNNYFQKSMNDVLNAVHNLFLRAQKDTRRAELENRAKKELQINEVLIELNSLLDKEEELKCRQLYERMKKPLTKRTVS